MSTLTDYQYAKYKAVQERPNDLSQINFDDVVFFEPNLLDSAYHVVRKILSGVAKGFWLIGKVFREDPEAHNERIAARKASPSLIRGLH